MIPSLATLALRLCTVFAKRWIGNLHASADADERVTMLKTYLALISDGTLNSKEVLRLVTTPSGTEIKVPDAQEKIMFASGMNAAEVLLPSVRPSLKVSIANHWSTERSAERAPSLARARRRISILADAVASS